MCAQGVRSPVNGYAVTLTPVHDSAGPHVDAVIFTARSRGTVEKVWTFRFNQLEGIFNHRFAPLTVAQMIVSLRHGKTICLPRHCGAMELLDLGYRPDVD